MLTPKPFPFVPPTPRRLSARKRVTLIAAFRCGEDAILCADSQETWGDYKASVTKLKPQDIGSRYQLAYAGSGYGHLVDDLGNYLEQQLAECRATDARSVQAALQGILVAFYERPAITVFPADPDNANASVSGVICLRVVQSEKVFLFTFNKTAVLPVEDFVLRGMEEPIYRHIAQRLYRPDLSPLQAQVLGLHLFKEAGATSTQIGGDTSVVFAMTYDMFAYDRGDELKVFADGVAAVQQAMDLLLIPCADTLLVSDAEVKALLKNFRRDILDLRREQVRRSKYVFAKYAHALGGHPYKPKPTPSAAQKRTRPAKRRVRKAPTRDR